MIPSHHRQRKDFHFCTLLHLFTLFESMKVDLEKKGMLFLQDIVTVSISNLFTRRKEDKVFYTLSSLFPFFFPNKNAFNLGKLLGKRECAMSVVPYFFVFFLDSVSWKSEVTKPNNLYVHLYVHSGTHRILISSEACGKVKRDFCLKAVKIPLLHFRKENTFSIPSFLSTHVILRMHLLPFLLPNECHVYNVYICNENK